MGKTATCTLLVREEIGRTNVAESVKLKNACTLGSAFPLVGIPPTGTHAHSDPCCSSVAYCSKDRRHPQSPPVGHWSKNVWPSSMVEYYTAIKKNAAALYELIWNEC